jgi:hypothetical protein
LRSGEGCEGSVGGERGRRDDVEADDCGEELELVSVMLVRCSEDAEGSSSGAFDGGGDAERTRARLWSGPREEEEGPADVEEDDAIGADNAEDNVLAVAKSFCWSSGESCRRLRPRAPAEEDPGEEGGWDVVLIWTCKVWWSG